MTSARTMPESKCFEIPRCDPLGGFVIDDAEAELAAQSIGHDLLEALTARMPAGSRLSRSGIYYDVPGLIRLAPRIAQGAKRLVADGECGTAAFALVEMLHNVVAGSTYALWDIAIDASDRRVSSLLDRGLRLGAGLAGSLAGSVGSAELVDVLEEIAHTIPQPDRWPRAMSGRFRELDNAAKIYDEVGFLTQHILPRYSIDHIVCPVYGALGLANALTAEFRHTDLDVWLLRLGFHDLAYLGFSDQRSIDLALTMPHWLRADAEEAFERGNVLIVDDNIGYGHTMRACRDIVAERGGMPVTRSVETAWELFDRVPGHRIQHVADLPSLRPNLHHSIQAALVGSLRRGEVDEYAAAARGPDEPVAEKLRRSRRRVEQQEGWRTEQLELMEIELADAVSWVEQPIPEYRGQR